jgi:hypothetical protein
VLISVIGRCSDGAEREQDRYAAWSAAVRQLQAGWADGMRPGIGDLRGLLEGVPAEHRRPAVQDLIAEHLRLTWQTGQGERLEAYLRAFAQELADLAAPAGVPADLVEDEFLARHLWPHGDAPPVEDYRQRFPARPDVLRLLQSRCLGCVRYVKLHRRGRGAMGDVYEAYDRHLRRPVAVKEPRPGLDDNADLLGRFAAEARLTAGLEHPGIVSVHEYHEDGAGTPFYVMRLVNGPTLGERIRDYHQPPADQGATERHLLWNQLLHSFAAVCAAMAYAHARGVVHRDLKPGNIVAGVFGATVILDWGMGQRLPPADGSETGPVVVGTPQYMPPEQADGRSDRRSDVFGLGAVLYELLTGRPPHAWPQPSPPPDWPRLVREARFPPPRRLNPGAPRALEAIGLKALSRAPDERYPSAGELAEDVRRYLAGAPVAAWAEPLAVRAWRWLGGRRPFPGRDER